MRILFTRLFVGLLAGLILFSSSQWQPGPFSAAGILLVALGLTSAAAVGRLWCSLYIAGYKKSCLVTDGPYAMCRNPLYFFSMLGTLGVALMTHTFTIPLLALISFAIYYPYVIRAEEEDLTKIHGAPFEAYRSRTPAFFPRWSLLKEPDTYQVKPRVFRNHMGSAVWFILAIGVIALLHAGRSLGHIPALISLY
ncbi:MAG: isoprenylcysteine carboxylmethyltransferase family protein [Verrucomicrobiota bacterium]